MLRHLPKAARLRATAVLAAAYALCVVAPHAALALTHAVVALHCLSEPMAAAHVHRASTLVEHIHADGSKHTHHQADSQSPTAHHSHGDHATGGHNDGNCCGLFCVTALAGNGFDVLPLPPSRSSQVTFLQSAGTSHIPGRLSEPPIG